MTVGELKEILSRYDENMLVLGRTYDKITEDDLFFNIKIKEQEVIRKEQSNISRSLYISSEILNKFTLSALIIY